MILPHPPPRIRHNKGLVLVCIAGVLGAWNFLSISPTLMTTLLARTLNQPAGKLFTQATDLGENTAQSTTSERLLSTIKSLRSTIDKVHNNRTLHQNVELDGIQSTFPFTRFTPHVMEVVNQYHFDKVPECHMRFHFNVQGENSQPTIQCEHGDHRGEAPKQWWCIVLRRRVFAPRKERFLPYNVSFGVSIEDFLYPRDRNACIGNSNNGGNFSITNFLEIKRMNPGGTRYKSLPWEERNRIPIFRGTPWVDRAKYRFLNRKNESLIYDKVLSMSPRLKAVDYSIRNPSLLDARVSRARPNLDNVENDPIWMENSTVGLYKLCQDDTIPMVSYYQDYQVAVVLCGIGAAFRTSVHMETSTAVVLQECGKHEWFRNLLVPFEHYIPLENDLSDLDEKMKWIQSHPQQVREIAERGRQFNLDYLSFERNEEHIYELIYRLALAKKEFDTKSVSYENRSRMKNDTNEAPDKWRIV